MNQESTPNRSEGENAFDREVFRNEVRKGVQNAIAHPENELIFLMDHITGRHSPPESAVYLDNLSIEKIQEFYLVVIEELERVKKNIKLSDALEEALKKQVTETKQTTFEHEIAHAREAEKQLTSLNNCRLELFFTESGFGLRVVSQFISPPDANPIALAYIALAPEEPSGPDRQLVRKILTEHRAYFESHPEQLTEIKNLYLRKVKEEFSF